MLVEFKLRGGGYCTLNDAVCDGQEWTGRDRGGKRLTLSTDAVVAERMLRDRHGWVGGRKRKRG